MRATTLSDRRATRYGADQVVLADLRASDPDAGCPAVALAELVEAAQAGLQMDVGAGDPEGEHEGNTVLQGGAHVRLDVGRLVGGHLVARPQPVRSPVAARALGDDGVDAPGEGPLDLGLDVGGRRDVVHESEDPDG
jgi:hypothetical protein